MLNQSPTSDQYLIQDDEVQTEADPYWSGYFDGVSHQQTSLPWLDLWVFLFVSAAMFVAGLVIGMRGGS